MIFVTIGTSEPFDRLLAAVAELPGDEELVVQCGESTVRPGNAVCVGFLPFNSLVERIRNARVVISHAGVGSIMTALANGKRPIVMPRLRRFGEAIDDHQVPFARHLAAEGLVYLIEDASELGAAVVVAEPNGGGLGGETALAADIRAYLLEATPLGATAAATTRS